MPIEPIHDADDPRVDDYRALNDQAARRLIEGDELFIAEGPTAVLRLLTSGHRVRSVLVEARKLTRILAELEPAGGIGAPIFTTSREVLRQIVGFDLHRGIVAAAERQPLAALDELLEPPGRLRLAVLEGLNDPENVGAVARSARAFGLDALVLDPTCTDPYARRTVRVSMGEVLHLRIARCSDWPGPIDELRDAGVSTWALTPGIDAHDLWELAVPERLAVVLGAEGPGLQPATIASCDRAVRIPIRTGVDSLNVGAAAAVTFAVTSR